MLFRNNQKSFSIKLFDVDFDFCRVSENHTRIEFINSRIPGICNGELALSMVCFYADHERITLSLLPASETKKGRWRLREWYRKHGFVDYEEGMIREPK